MQINVKKLHPDAVLPIFGTMGAACFDIFSVSAAEVHHGNSAAISTGLAFEIPEGYALMLYSRSGHAYKHDVRLANCVGVIDSDYRGELKVMLAADDPDYSFQVVPGERIAQGMIIRVPAVGFKEVEELSQTERGTGGFGSTGN